MVFQFIWWHLTLGGIERSNQGHLVFIGLCIMHNVLLDSGAVMPRGLLLCELGPIVARCDFLEAAWDVLINVQLYTTSFILVKFLSELTR